MTRITFSAPDELEDAIDAIQKSSGETAEIPVLSKSKIIRLLVRDAALRLASGEGLLVDEEDVDGDALADLVPDHAVARILREDVKDENWLVDMREGFEGRVRNELAKRFRSGYDPDGVAAFAEGFVREAHIYWQIIEEDEATYQDKVKFIHEKVEEYRAKHEASTYDPDEEWLDGFGGVEEGERERVADAIPDEILEEIHNRVSVGRSATAIADMIANRYGVDPDLAEELVDRAKSADRALTAEDLRGALEENGDAPALPDGGIDA